MRLFYRILFLFCLCTQTFAAAPLWTFTPLTSTTLSIPANATAIVQYQVTNQSAKSHTLTVKAVNGVTQLTTGFGVCGNPFVLAGRSSCVLSLQIAGSALTQPITGGPVACEKGSLLQCYQPSQTDVLRITQASSSDSVLLYGITPSSGITSGGTSVTLSGSSLSNANSVTFGGVSATSFNIVNSTTITAVTPAHAAGVVDVAVSTPDGTAQLVNGYTYVTTAIGLQAFGGVVACLNGGLNNLITSVADNSTGISWGGFGLLTGANSNTDGASNTALIVSFLGTNGGIPYAAKLCDDYEVDSQGNTPCEPGNVCYNDWFLPSGGNSTSSGQLFCLYTNSGSIGGFSSTSYWSSTEFDSVEGFIQDFLSGTLNTAPKNDASVRVRCVRTFTP